MGRSVNLQLETEQTGTSPCEATRLWAVPTCSPGRVSITASPKRTSSAAYLFSFSYPSFLLLLAAPRDGIGKRPCRGPGRRDRKRERETQFRH